MQLGVWFPIFLLSSVCLTGGVLLAEACRVRARSGQVAPFFWGKCVEYARAFFPMLLMVFIIRSFLFQPYRVPTGSLKPTIMPGDFIIASQYAYGLRLPISRYKLLNIGQPKRGDVVLFHWPEDPRIIYAKRVVGLPGDHVQYKQHVLFINGKAMVQTPVKQTWDWEPHRLPYPVIEKIEQLAGRPHPILLRLDKTKVWAMEVDMVLPSGHYFMLGDNRDNSYDSRYWGTVPERLLIGKVLGIWMSWDSVRHRVRWERMGRVVH